ncbi:hypothetical protein GCM10009789_18700 [Kribbella sancticallisti]|uniref:Universal stress protein family protein n=1 Tax=Kribbella sancticallisti TaxID=460087 RepID=A0ABP4NSP7_9ACTN
MIIAVDADSADTVEAEHLLHNLLESVPGPVVACTHVVSGGDRPHLAVSVSTPADFDPAALTHDVGSAIIRPGAAEPVVAGPSQLVRGAYVAAVETALGTAGRLVAFPGQENARGVLTAAELRTHCGIDQVEALGGLIIEDTTLIDTRDFIRPIRRNGQVTLLVQPAVGGVLIPFEVEHQQKCCADH